MSSPACASGSDAMGPNGTQLDEAADVRLEYNERGGSVLWLWSMAQCSSGGDDLISKWLQISAIEWEDAVGTYEPAPVGEVKCKEATSR